MTYWVWDRKGDWTLKPTGTPGVYENQCGMFQYVFWCLSPTRTDLYS